MSGQYYVMTTWLFLISRTKCLPLRSEFPFHLWCGCKVIIDYYLLPIAYITYSYAIKNQRKARNAPSRGLWDEMPPNRDISCLSLVLYGIRIGNIGNR